MNNDIIAMELKKLADQQGLLTVLSAFGRNLKFSLPLSSELCGNDINDLCLSVRSGNALHRVSVNNVGSMAELIMRDGLNNIRNLGKKSVSEIKTTLLVYGYDQLSEGQKLQFWRKFAEDNLQQKTV